MVSIAKQSAHCIFPRSVAKRELSISSFRWMAPLQRRKRIIAVLPYHNIGEVDDSYLAREIALCTRRITCNDGNLLGCFSALKHRFSTIRSKERHCTNIASMAGLTVGPCSSVAGSLFKPTNIILESCFWVNNCCQIFFLGHSRNLLHNYIALLSEDIAFSKGAANTE